MHTKHNHLSRNSNLHLWNSIALHAMRVSTIDLDL